MLAMGCAVCPPPSVTSLVGPPVSTHIALSPPCSPCPLCLPWSLWTPWPPSSSRSLSPSAAPYSPCPPSSPCPPCLALVSSSTPAPHPRLEATPPLGLTPPLSDATEDGGRALSPSSTPAVTAPASTAPEPQQARPAASGPRSLHHPGSGGTALLDASPPRGLTSPRPPPPAPPSGMLRPGGACAWRQAAPLTQRSAPPPSETSSTETPTFLPQQLGFSLNLSTLPANGTDFCFPGKETSNQ